MAQGRGGLGTVYVWAAGNGGLPDDCNLDGWAATHHSIAVSATAHDGQWSLYSEPCAAIMVTAPSNRTFTVPSSPTALLPSPESVFPEMVKLALLVSSAVRVGSRLPPFAVIVTVSS